MYHAIRNLAIVFTLVSCGQVDHVCRVVDPGSVPATVTTYRAYFQNADVALLIVAGQSNAVGKDGVGPAEAVWAQWPANYPHLRIIKVAIGGTGMSPKTHNSRWNPTNGDLFIKLKESIADELASLAGKRVAYVGMIWSQWEADSVAHAADEYMSNVRALRTMVDSEIGMIDSPFFYWMPVSELPDVKQYQNIYANETLLVPNTYPVNAASFNGTVFKRDCVHFTVDAQMWGGAEVIKEL